MSAWRVNMVSAFGRGESLILALKDAGFQVQILDFSAAFPVEFQRGAGPFPLVNKCYLDAQEQILAAAQPLPTGLSFWLKDGPIDLAGPMAPTHALANPAVRAWSAGESSPDFSTAWLGRYLRQWASPYFAESWSSANDSAFPAALSLGVLPVASENSVFSFGYSQSRGVEVHSCQTLSDLSGQSQRITGVEVNAGSAVAFEADQWIWCLSSLETRAVGEEGARKLFWRGTRTPEWAWLSFEGQMARGPWSHGLPPYVVVIGDIYLPWQYANASILRRLDETRCRFWLKVPRARVAQIDARREWAQDLEGLLNQRLALADWKIDSAQWSVCPHSEVYSQDARDENLVHWKNWDWISPETLPRLDLGARLEREAEAFRRLTQWRNDQIKKQGARLDQPLHAP